MISTKTLLQCLTGLISLDIVLTLIMVGFLGATELNVLASMFGFGVFTALKIVASAAAIYTIYKYCIPSTPFVARYGIIMLGVVYGGVFASNAYQVVGRIVWGT